jgi:hypothetical protein
MLEVQSLDPFEAHRRLYAATHRPSTAARYTTGKLTTTGTTYSQKAGYHMDPFSTVTRAGFWRHVLQPDKSSAAITYCSHYIVGNRHKGLHCTNCSHQQLTHSTVRCL